MVSQCSVFLIAIICSSNTSPIYTKELINEETLRVAEDLQKLTEKYGEKSLNFDKLNGLAGDLQLQIKSLFQDMANDAADYVRQSIRDTAQGVYSNMRETTLLDVTQMIFDNMLGDTSSMFNQNFQQSGAGSIITSTVTQGVLGTNVIQKPDPTLSDNSPVINIINQNAPLMSNNGSSVSNQPGFQTSNQIFVFINNGSTIPDTANAVNVIDTLKPGINTLGTINKPFIAGGAQSTIFKPKPVTDNKVTLAVSNNNDLNFLPYQPSIASSSSVVLGTNGNVLHSSVIPKPDSVIHTLFTEKPSFVPNGNIQNVGLKPGNILGNNVVYSAVGGMAGQDIQMDSMDSSKNRKWTRMIFRLLLMI